jgi:hypothetical protein
MFEPIFNVKCLFSYSSLWNTSNMSIITSKSVEVCDKIQFWEIWITLLGRRRVLLHEAQKQSAQLGEVHWGESEPCNNKRTEEPDSPATWCRPCLLDPVVICQNNSIKMGSHKRWKSQTWRLYRMSVSVFEPFVVWQHSACHCCQLYQLFVCFILDCTLPLIYVITSEQLGQYIVLIVQSVLVTGHNLLFFSSTQLLEVLGACFEVLVLSEDVLAVCTSHKFLAMS